MHDDAALLERLPQSCSKPMRSRMELLAKTLCHPRIGQTAFFLARGDWYNVRRLYNCIGYFSPLELKNFDVKKENCAATPVAHRRAASWS
ncbi:hypothetical protein [Paraburkholderia youngii]|uniref:hypothetical protein n=1 Tax=Paraburkholderia youngii TaxID=2782701 RepID=UPI003D213E02